MPTRNISNLTHIATGFLSITEIPFWLNPANKNQIVIMLSGRLQLCSVKTIYSYPNQKDSIVRIQIEEIAEKPDYIIAVSLTKLAIWLIPEHAITGNKILRLGKCYEQYKYSIVDTALKHSQEKVLDSDLRDKALEVVRASRGSKFEQMNLEEALKQEDSSSLIVDKS